MKFSIALVPIFLILLSECYGRTTLERERRDTVEAVEPVETQEGTQEASPKIANPINFVKDASKIITKPAGAIASRIPFNPFNKGKGNAEATSTEGNQVPVNPVAIEPVVTPKPEKGHFSGFGRDLVTKLSDVVTRGVTRVGKFISPNTGGLDTEPNFFNKITGTVTGIASTTTKQFMSHVNSIYPGTRWCGGGNISDAEESLGLFAGTDACCRDHDKCPDNMDSGEVRNGLHNKGLFTRSHCGCDLAFFKCLRKNFVSPIASSIGVTYFNILGPQCYKEDFPIRDCKNWVMTASNLTKCTEYDLDTNALPVYQWFDNPLFVGLPELKIRR